MPVPDWWQAMQAAHSGLEASASLTHTPAGQHAAQGFIDCWQTMQGAHSGLTASAGLSHTPAVHSAAQGRPSLQGPSPTPDMHSPFSPSSYMQQPTAAHADELSPLFSQASSPFWPTGASDRARPTDLASETGAPLCEWSAKAGEETASAWPVADSSSSPMRRALSGVAELPAAGFEGREVTAVICGGGRARSAVEQTSRRSRASLECATNPVACMSRRGVQQPTTETGAEETIAGPWLSATPADRAHPVDDDDGRHGSAAAVAELPGAAASCAAGRRWCARHGRRATVPMCAPPLPALHWRTC